MRLSWNEIRVRAKAFSDNCKDAAYEKGETQSFYNDFLRSLRRQTPPSRTLRGSCQRPKRQFPIHRPVLAGHVNCRTKERGPRPRQSRNTGFFYERRKNI